MRKIHKLLPAVTLALAATKASAQLVYEPFDYPAGNTNLENQVNQGQGTTWLRMGSSVVSTDQTLKTVADPLATITGLPPSVGNQLAYHGTTNGVSQRLGFGPVIGSGSVYWSMGVKLTALSSLPTSQIFVCGLNNLVGSQTASPSTAGARLHVARLAGGNNTDFVIGLSKNSSNQSDVQWEGGTFGSVTHAINDTIFLVGGYDIVSGTNNDTAHMWINPSSTDFGAASAPTPTINSSGSENTSDLNNGGPSSVASFVYRASNTNVPFIVADDLRIDTTWAGVTPRADKVWTYAGTGSGTWSSAGNWADSTNTTGVSTPNSNSAVAVLGSNITGGPATITVDSAQTIGGLTLNNTNAITVSGAGLTFDTNAGEGNLIDQQGSHDVASSLTMATNKPLAVRVQGASDTLTVSGNILASSTGAESLYKFGPGTALLSGSNTFTGGVKIYAGALAVSSDAAFGAVPGAATANITVDGGTLRFDAPMTVNANRSVTLGVGTAVGGSGGATFNTNGSNVTIAGAVSGSGGNLIKTGNGTLTLSGAVGHTGATSVNAGTLELQTNLTTSSSVNVSAAGTLKLADNGTFNRVIKTPAVTVTGTGRLDIDNNKLIVTGASAVGTWNGTAYTGTTALIASGYGPNQDFSGSGIVTSQSNASGGNTLTNIGIASNTDLGLATFGGTTVGANDTLVMYTYGGDANLDGIINGDDYFQIDSAFPTGGHGWFNGDFNYDGVVNGDDYFIIDSNFPAQGAAIPTSGGIAGVQAVPEPASIGMLGLAAAGLFGRRRRKD